MKKKFFFKRVAIYLGMMLLPMTLLFTAFCVLNLRTIDRDLKRQGRQTVDAVDVNFDLVLSNVLYQNDLLTSTTRMNLSLKRILSQSEMAYGDAVNIDSFWPFCGVSRIPMSMWSLSISTPTARPGIFPRTRGFIP